MASVEVFQLESHDFEEMSEAFNTWDQEYRQMSHGLFHGSAFHVQVGPFSIFRERWGRKIHYHGITPKGTCALAIPLHQTGDIMWMGKRITEEEIIVQCPGQEGNLLSGPTWDSIVITIPEAILAGHMANLTQGDTKERLHSHGVLHLKPEQVSSVRNASLACLHTAIHLATGPATSFPLVEMVDSVVEFIARQMVTSRKLTGAPRSHQHHTHLMRKIESYCMDQVEQPLQMSVLCRAFNISERTLYHVFRKQKNMTPLDYLKKTKLNRVYKTLRRAQADEVLIKQVAYTNGFFHLGQFSQDYKKLFGELPSHTLQQKQSLGFTSSKRA